MYLPFWSYASDTRTQYAGERGEHYYETESYTETDNNGNTVQQSRQVGGVLSWLAIGALAVPSLRACWVHVHKRFEIDVPACCCWRPPESQFSEHRLVDSVLCDPVVMGEHTADMEHEVVETQIVAFVIGESLSLNLNVHPDRMTRREECHWPEGVVFIFGWSSHCTGSLLRPSGESLHIEPALCQRHRECADIEHVHSDWYAVNRLTDFYSPVPQYDPLVVRGGGYFLDSLNVTFKGLDLMVQRLKGGVTGLVAITQSLIHGVGLSLDGFEAFPRNVRINCRDIYDDPFRAKKTGERFFWGLVLLVLGWFLDPNGWERLLNHDMRWLDYLLLPVGLLFWCGGFTVLALGHLWPPKQECSDHETHAITVSQKLLTPASFPYYAN